MSDKSKRRATLASVVIGLWLGGLAFLGKKELFRPHMDKLADAGLRVAPGASYYAVLQQGQQIGFASSTIDTTDGGISAHDYLRRMPVGADAPSHGANGSEPDAQPRDPVQDASRVARAARRIGADDDPRHAAARRAPRRLRRTRITYISPPVRSRRCCLSPPRSETDRRPVGN